MRQRKISTVTFSILISLLSFTTPAGAQNGGTIVSRYGIGELNLQTTARQRGMGEVSISLLSSYDINQTNPAAWTAIDGVRLQGGLSLENVENTIGSTNSTGRTATIQGMQFALPMWKEKGITINLGFLPISRSAYKVQTVGEEMNEGYRLKYESTGGLSMFRVGISYQPLSSVHVGAAYNYNFGSTSQKWFITFNNGTFQGTDQSRTTSHNGSTVTFGAMYSGMKDLTIGASLTTGTELHATRDQFFSYSTHDSTVMGESGSVTLPMTFGIGASYLIDNSILAAVDFRSQDWSTAFSFDKAQPELRSMQKIGAGIEFLPSTETGASFFQRWAFRLGAYYRTSYVRLQNQSSNELVFTTGIGFPIGAYTRGDIALEYGSRGDKTNLVGMDTIFRLSFSISASELWFVRRGEEE